MAIKSEWFSSLVRGSYPQGDAVPLATETASSETFSSVIQSSMPQPTAKIDGCSPLTTDTPHGELQTTAMKTQAADAVRTILLISRLPCEKIDTATLTAIELNFDALIESPESKTFFQVALQHPQLRQSIIDKYLHSHKELILSALADAGLPDGYGPCVLMNAQKRALSKFYSKHSDQLTWPLAQAAYILDRTDKAGTGCCVGITMHWLDRSKVGKESFSTSKKSPEIKEAEGAWDARTAKKFGKFHQLQLLHNDKAMETAVLYDNEESLTLPPANVFTALAPKNCKQGFVIMITPPQGGTGHAMGMTTDYRDPENPVIMFMDPNIGEFRFSLKTEQPAWEQFANDLFGGYATRWKGFSTIEATEFETMLTASKAP